MPDMYLSQGESVCVQKVSTRTCLLQRSGLSHKSSNQVLTYFDFPPTLPGKYDSGTPKLGSALYPSAKRVPHRVTRAAELRD
jgi:hypothetical protein